MEAEEANKGNVGSLFDNLTSYIDTKVDIIKLKLIQKTTDVISSIVSRIAILSIAFMAIMLINIGAGLWLGNLLGKNYYGFFALAGFYIIVILILNNSKGKLIKGPVAAAIIKKSLK